MKEITRSRLAFLAGGILIFTAISQILLAADRITAATAVSGLVGVAVFGVLLSIVRGLAAETEFYEAHGRRLRARSLMEAQGAHEPRASSARPARKCRPDSRGIPVT